MKLPLLFLSVFLSASFFGQDVYIPDANFKMYLVANPDINTNGDMEIQVSEAVAFGGAIDCNNLGISDLTGIEAFTSLMYLDCGNNQLTSLDVSQNITLMYLDCAANQLTSIDVSQNTALEEFACMFNQLTSLDVSQNPALTNLGCIYNQLTCLNIANGNNINLETFWVEFNPNLTCIEVDDTEWATANLTMWIDPQNSFSEYCNYPESCFDSTVGISELTTFKNLIQILDLMGRETPFKPNTPLIYVYDDGSTEKVLTFE